MTQIWQDDKVLAVTPVLAKPCTVTQVKTLDKDGYLALQVAMGKRREKNINKPQLGHFKAAGVSPAKVREFRTDQAESFKVGDLISVETFVVGDLVKATGTSKGKGFQGVVKRHGFAGSRKTHGNKDQERMPGAIGPKGPARVFKGTKMGGRMGNERVSVSNLEIVQIDADTDTIYLKGAIPGAINGLIMLETTGELKVNLKPVESDKQDEPKEEKREEVEVKEEVKEEKKEEKEVKEEKKEEPKKEEKEVEETKEEKPKEAKEEKPAAKAESETK